MNRDDQRITAGSFPVGAQNIGLPDQELVLAAQAGAAEAMDALLTCYRTALCRAARRFSSRPDEIDDLVQETMLRAFRKVQTFRGEAQFSTWLITILNNIAISRKRKKAVQWVSIDDQWDQPLYPVIHEIPDTRRNPEQQAIREELLLILRATLDRQPAKDQQILMACVIDEGSICDVARNMGASIASVRSRLFRAKRGLTESCRRRGIVRRSSNAAHCEV